MFICQITNKVSSPGEKCNKLVVQTRPRVYTQRVYNEETREVETLEVGRGWEVVRELKVSLEGVELWNSWTPEHQQLFLKQM